MDIHDCRKSNFHGCYRCQPSTERNYKGNRNIALKQKEEVNIHDLFEEALISEGSDSASVDNSKTKVNLCVGEFEAMGKKINVLNSKTKVNLCVV